MKTIYTTIIAIMLLLLLVAAKQCEQGGSLTVFVGIAAGSLGALGALVWSLDHAHD